LFIEILAGEAESILAFTGANDAQICLFLLPSLLLIMSLGIEGTPLAPAPLPLDPPLVRAKRP